MSTAVIAQRSRMLAPASWPFYVAIVGYPLWWALGLGYFIWPLLAVPFLFGLIYKGDVHFPRVFGFWALFLVLTPLSATQLDDVDLLHIGLFLYRYSIFLSAGIFFLYVYNASREKISDRDCVLALAALWMFAVIGGAIGIFFPHFSFSTPMEALVPAAWLQEQTAYYFVHPGLSEVMTFLGYPVGRPKTLFAYTNQWGSTVAFLTPFAFAAIGQLRPGIFRAVLRFSLVLAVLPVIVSLNRGLWLSLGIGLVYISLRLARRFDYRPVALFGIIIPIIALVFFTTAMGQLVTDRLTSEENSNNARAAVYEQSIDGVKESPLIGHGAPRALEGRRDIARAGTQGEIWFMTFSYGIPAFILFFGFFFVTFFGTISLGGLSFWANAAFLILLCQVMFYNWQPITLHLAMVAAGFAWRAKRLERA